LVVIIIRLIFLQNLEKHEINYFANHHLKNIQGPAGCTTFTEFLVAHAGDTFADAFPTRNLGQTRHISTKDWEIKMNLVKRGVWPYVFKLRLGGWVWLSPSANYKWCGSECAEQPGSPRRKTGSVRRSESFPND